MATQENPAIRIDAESGRKLFNTRAKIASERVAGQGYGVTENAEYKALPDFKPNISFDGDAQAKQDAFKEARRDVDDYMPMEGEFARYLEDHYTTPPVDRESLNDECEILVVGAGFAALLLWYKLCDAGFTDVRFCERGGDVGGTWYWNRYPGAACDVESYSYLPLLDEMEYFPKMKFASGFEIYEYCQKIAEKYGFYDHCLFHTEVTESRWSDEAGKWTVKTNRGDEMKARFVMMANGTLSTPRLARINGMEKFQGESFHTARWDYDLDLTGKRVGIIGTGATAIQLVPEIAKQVDHLYVFQRTPSTVDVRDQRETTPEEIAEWKNEPGWAAARRKRFSSLYGRRALRANDGFLSGKEEKPKRRMLGGGKRLSLEEMVETELQTSYRIMEQIRDRIDAVVEDPEVAKAMKPYYPYGCKRPNFHDEYLPTFNQPHVDLVDTAPLGVQEINEKGVVHDGKVYELDVLIYATGFDFMSRESLGHLYDANGRSVADKWEEVGTKTFVGLHTNGFPNLFIIAGPQGTGGSFNFIDAIEEHTDYVPALLTRMRDQGATVIDAKQEAEEAFTKHCIEADEATKKLRDCLGNFTGYGRAAAGSLGYYGGKQASKIRAHAVETLEPFIVS